MSVHCTKSQIEGFCGRTLELESIVAVGEHLADCAQCHQLFHEVFQTRRRSAPTVINLSTEKWLLDEHLDYEWLTSYVAGSMVGDEREMVELHLSLCKQCQDEVEDFSAWQRALEAELKIQHAFHEPAALWDRFKAWFNVEGILSTPRYGSTLLVIVLVAVTLALWLLLSKSGSPPKQQASTSPSPEVSEPISNRSESPSPVPPPPPPIQRKARLSELQHRLRVKTGLQENDTATASDAVLLNDNGNKVGIDRSGRLIGLEGLPPEVRESVKDFLLSDNIAPPTALSDLAKLRSDLRGEGNPSHFKLLSPSGIVIADAHAVFKWEQLKGADGYRVYVSDSRRRKVSDSGVLAATETQWMPSSPLKRGDLYTWAVGAVVNGEEVIAPAISEPEVKFAVLSEEKLRELNRLRRNTGSHLALGVFYAQNGMLTEAERELQKLASVNSNSVVVQRLLNIVQSWR